MNVALNTNTVSYSIDKTSKAAFCQVGKPNAHSAQVFVCLRVELQCVLDVFKGFIQKSVKFI